MPASPALTARHPENAGSCCSVFVCRPQAAEAAFIALQFNMGQCCAAGSRTFVHEGDQHPAYSFHLKCRALLDEAPMSGPVLRAFVVVCHRHLRRVRREDCGAGQEAHRGRPLCRQIRPGAPGTRLYLKAKHESSARFSMHARGLRSFWPMATLQCVWFACRWMRSSLTRS